MSTKAKTTRARKRSGRDSESIHGHCGFVESCSPAGDVVTTVEGDTNAEGSSTGDAVGRHTWTPASGERGRLLGYLDIG